MFDICPIKLLSQREIESSVTLNVGYYFPTIFSISDENQDLLQKTCGGFNFHYLFVSTNRQEEMIKLLRQKCFTICIYMLQAIREFIKVIPRQVQKYEKI